MKKVIARTLLLAVCWTCPVDAQSAGTATRDPAIAQLVRDISDDSATGRGLGTTGLTRASNTLMRALADRGFVGAMKPLRQSVPIQAAQLDTLSAVLFVGPNPYDGHFGLNSARFRVGTDFLPVTGLFGLQFPRISQTAEVRVLFGGRLGTSQAIDPAQTRALIVVFLPPLREGGLPDYQVWRYQAEIARYKMAAAVLIAAGDVLPPAAFDQFTAKTYELEGTWKPFLIDGPPVALVSRVAASVIVHDAVEAIPIGIMGKQITAALRFQVRSSEVRGSPGNVYVIVEGSDPIRKSEYVVVTAPLDHLGIASPDRRVGRDSVFNGADAATGAAALLDVASKMLQQRPARSVVFLWTVGQSAQLGSGHFVENSPIPRDRIVANINVDMIGRGGENDLAGGGPNYMQVAGSRRLSSQFGAWVDEVNKSSGANFSIDYSFDAPGHPARYACNGDHWNFARSGIPNVFVTTGTHADYNTVKDEVDRIDFNKLARVTGFIGALAMDIANRPARPVIDKAKPDPRLPCVQ